MDFPFAITLERRKTRHVRLRVTSPNSVEVTIPWLLPKKYAFDFIQKKKSWIEKKQRLCAEKEKRAFSFLGRTYQPIPSPEIPLGVVRFSGKIVNIGAKNISEAARYFEKFLKQEAKRTLKNEIMLLSKKHNFPFHRLFLRAQKSRWGSCSSLKNISLNVHLLKLRQELREYVIIHELCHTKELNHSKRFWRLVEQHCPDYKNLRQELHLYAPKMQED